MSTIFFTTSTKIRQRSQKSLLLSGGMKQNNNNNNNSNSEDIEFIHYSLVSANSGHHQDNSPWQKWDLRRFWKSIKSDTGDHKVRKKQSSGLGGISGIHCEPILPTTAASTDISCTMHVGSFIEQGELESKQDQRLKDEPLYKFLSQATSTDQFIFNDMLKIIMVGDQSSNKSSLARAIVGKELQVSSSTFPGDTPQPIGVNYYKWTPKDQISLTCTLWDVSSVGAIAHPLIQALFFSPKSLYILVWDLAASNQQVIRRVPTGNHKDHPFYTEQQRKRYEQILEWDIQDRVLSWIDYLFPNFADGSAILPVAIVPVGMEESEVQHRCNILQNQLECHPVFTRENSIKLILANNGDVSTVNLDTQEGLHELQKTITRLGVLAPLNLQDTHFTMKVLDKIRQLKYECRKVVSVAHLLSEIKNEEDVMKTLQFLSSIGEILYFGTLTTNGILSQLVILSSKWLASVLLCTFSPESRGKLAETDFVKILHNGKNSCCPIVSVPVNVWQDWNFIMQVSETVPTLYCFLMELFQKSAILWPLNKDSNPTYFVPALLDQVEPRTVVSKKEKQSWQTTICHSWLLLDRSMANRVMKYVTIDPLQNLYKFNQICNNGFSIDQIIFWKSSVFVRFGQVCRPFTDVHLTLIDESSENCVDKASMGFGMMRLNVTGKGQKGLGGYNIWKGGYGTVLNSVRLSLEGFGTIRQVVCPDCLHQLHPSIASTWSWECIKQAVSNGEEKLRCCHHGHHVSTSLLCGTVKIQSKNSPDFKEVHS